MSEGGGSVEGARLRPVHPVDVAPHRRADGLLGSSNEFTRLLDLARRLAQDDAPLLLHGESGTGKDLLARRIHAWSPRADGPFVTLNLAAKPFDLLDREILGGGASAPAYANVPRHLLLSRGGTLYLDDICRAPPGAQARLVNFLRNPRLVLEDGREGPWAGRIIAATNLDPRHAIREGRFRRDLFDFLSVSFLHLPSLRYREGDAAEIAATLYPRLLAELGLPECALSQRLLAQISTLPWPGNLRELINALRRMALTPEAARGELPELPSDIRAEASPGHAPGEVRTFAEIERRAILAALERNAGSVPRASEELQLAASTIYRKLKSWNL